MPLECARPLFLTVAALLFLLPLCAAAGDGIVSSDDAVQPGVVESFAGVRGTVTDTAGKPLLEAGIAVTAATALVPDMLVLSGPDGSYSWSLPAGTFSLTANHGGYRAQTREVTVPEGAIVELDFRLERGP